jgi:ferredoxin-NADP reductase
VQTQNSDSFSVAVTRKVELVPGVVELTLQSTDGSPLPTWEPGAHIDLELPNGLTRQYSLCSDPQSADTWRVAVLREDSSRGGSEYIHAELAEGARISVKGPRNNFPLAPAEEYLFIAGGIGITPLLPMIRQVAAQGASWRLVYGGRSKATMAYRDELENSYPQRVTVCPQDETGLLDLATLLAEHRPGLAVYACGPAPMLVAIKEHSTSWPTGTVHMEAFTPLTEATSDSDSEFDVTLASNGATYTIPADQTILSVLRDNDVLVDWSCEEGTCSTCETRVIEGIPDHRDSVLTDEEREANEVIIVCVSRAKSPSLVLDL